MRLVVARKVIGVASVSLPYVPHGFSYGVCCCLLNESCSLPPGGVCYLRGFGFSHDDRILSVFFCAAHQIFVERVEKLPVFTNTYWCHGLSCATIMPPDGNALWAIALW